MPKKKIFVHQLIQNSDVVGEQKFGSGWVRVLHFGLGLGSRTKNIGDYPSGFRVLRVKVRVGLGLGSSGRVSGFRVPDYITNTKHHYEISI